MQFSLDEAQRFFRLHHSLMVYVNYRLRVVDPPVVTVEEYRQLPPAGRYLIHELFPKHTDLIQAFVVENPFRFDEADLRAIWEWHHLVRGTFCAYRPLRNAMIFMTRDPTPVAYGVAELASPFEAVIGPMLPRTVRTTLLPFQGRIVHDGLIHQLNVYLGGEFQRQVRRDYREARRRFGIITSLPPRADGAPPAKRARAARPMPERVEALTDAFCWDHLNPEYALLCRKMVTFLACLRPSPLTRGRPESWASGILKVIAWANCLDHPDRPDRIRLSDFDHLMGVSEATGTAKAMAIRDRLGIRRSDPGWALPRRRGRNPLSWMIPIHGMLADARYLPRPYQEKALRCGLIPYIPDDRADEAAPK